MPARSQSQFRLMAAIAHGAKLRRKPKGLTKAVAKEFVAGGMPAGLPAHVQSTRTGNGRAY